MPDSPTANDPRPEPTRLPGVGASLELRDVDGHRLDVVRRNDDSVMLYPESPTSCIELDPAVARSMGAFVTGHYRLAPDTAERLADVLGGLVIDWVRVEPTWSSIGRSIDELEVRRRTGITIIAILRGSQPIVSPEPTVRITAHDDLVVAGRIEDREAFDLYMSTGR
jgi:TrkA domain protein